MSQSFIGFCKHVETKKIKMDANLAQNIVETCIAYKKKHGSLPILKDMRDNKIIFEAFKTISK
jgi:hypothetical protein